MHLDIGVVAIRLARQQRFKLAALAFGLQRPEDGEALLLGRRIALDLAEFDQRRRVVEFALQPGDPAEPVFEHGALAHQLLRRFRIVPQAGILGLGVQFGEATRGGLDVKDASSAIPWTA